MDKYSIDFTGATWKKSERSGPNCDNCVQVAYVAGHYGLQDSKNPTGPVLVFDQGEWDAFTAGVGDGEFNF